MTNYIINVSGEKDYLAVLVTDKTRLVGNRGRNLERMLRRDNAHKILAMVEMGAPDDALHLALRLEGWASNSLVPCCAVRDRQEAGAEL